MSDPAGFFRDAFAYFEAYRRGDHTTCDRIAKAGNDRDRRTEQISRLAPSGAEQEKQS